MTIDIIQWICCSRIEKAAHLRTAIIGEKSRKYQKLSHEKLVIGCQPAAGSVAIGWQFVEKGYDVSLTESCDKLMMDE